MTQKKLDKITLKMLIGNHRDKTLNNILILDNRQKKPEQADKRGG